MSTSLIDEIMSFDPQDLSTFQEKGPKADGNLNIYKPNPKDSKSEDGVYRSKVKILLNPFNPKESIVNQATYWMQALDGSRVVRSSLSIGDRNCPIFSAWKRLWFSGDDNKKEFSRKIFNKNESRWVLVQILEDENKPELVGKFRLMKLAKVCYDKLTALMNPSQASNKTPYPVMDYVIGLTLELDVKPGPDDPQNPERKQRETSYDLSAFGDYSTVIKTDGTPLLTDEEIELVDAYVTAINNILNGKTAKKKEDGKKAMEEIKPKLHPIYQKVVEYVTANAKDVSTGEALDVAKYCGFREWDESTKTFVQHFTEMTDACVDPSTMTYEQFRASYNTMITEPAPAVASPATPTTDQVMPKLPDDLPF